MSNGNISSSITGLLPLLVILPIVGVTLKQIEKIGGTVDFENQKLNGNKRR